MLCFHVHMCTTCMPSTLKDQKGSFGFPGTGVANGCKLMWALGMEPGSTEEQ